ncbi:MAG: nitrate reductase cytochrome c-type subunit [Candidatus Mariimomonas ferrooxydans]
MRYSFLFTLFFVLFFTAICSNSALSENVFQFTGLVTGKPGMNTYPASLPGETIKLERPYKGAPPQVPHNVTEFIIKRDENNCLDCHLEGMEVEKGHNATKVPASHLLNEYKGKDEKEKIAGIRYNCLQCHVPQAEEEFPFDPGGLVCD